MTRKEILLLIARLEEELANIGGLVEELQRKGYWPRTGNTKGSGEPIPIIDDSFTLRALGSILHDFYVAAENMFEAVARDLDEKLPEGANWHQALLRQMTIPISQVRPAVLREYTATQLDEYRAFRHVFRNVYGFNLDAGRLKYLLLKLPQVVAALSQDIGKFIENLRANLPEGEEGVF